MTDFETYRTMVASTAHLPPFVARDMDERWRLPYLYSVEEYGYRLWVPSELDGYENNWPDALRPIMVAAFRQGCKWVDFDQDGPEYEDYAQWEW